MDARGRRARAASIDFDMPRKHPQFALVLSGAVSRLNERTASPTLPGGVSDSLFSVNSAAALYDAAHDVVPLHVSAAGIHRHVVLHNGGDEDWDVFAHSWNPELEMSIRRHFGPLCAATFEDNRPVERNERHTFPHGALWSQVSWAISRATATELMLRHATRRGQDYARVLFMRFDVLITKDVDLPSLPPLPDVVYVGHETGDLHFLTASSSSACVRTLRDLPSIVRNSSDTLISGVATGMWIPRALYLAGHCRVVVDPVAQWRDEEVLRKLRTGPIPVRPPTPLHSACWTVAGRSLLTVAVARLAVPRPRRAPRSIRPDPARLGATAAGVLRRERRVLRRARRADALPSDKPAATTRHALEKGSDGSRSLSMRLHRRGRQERIRLLAELHARRWARVARAPLARRARSAQLMCVCVCVCRASVVDVRACLGCAASGCSARAHERRKIPRSP